ncbi:hypothetical protein SDC9_78442 [bioreactor metagenome]|uniref:Uncharacterized protein n=1 Tax=bioreactor metagenome TaxID=1076179 RepID=A0A644YTI2_9ZZZZ
MYLAPYSLPHTRNYMYYTTLSNGLSGQAEIETKINATEDVQSGNFISLNSVTTRQYGTAINFVSWTQNSHNLKISSVNYLISGTIDGTLTTEYVVSATGTRVRVTKDHLISIVCYSEAHGPWTVM